MKVCITAAGEGLSAPADPRFGRAPHFVLVETDTRVTTTVPNAGARAGHGAGVEAAQTVAAWGVHALVTGHCGPNAFRVLQAAGIEVFTGASGTVDDSLQAFLDGRLDRAEAPDVAAGGRR